MNINDYWEKILFILLFSCNSLVTAGAFDGASFEALLSIPIEKVTTVTKFEQLRFDAPAAVYVISNEDIRRSGVTNIADALRLAPGIDVGRIDHNKWAVSSRGLNSRFANKLLVMIDDHSIYNPLFAGVSWDEHGLMLEDIDHIEVIRGPGGSLWGANAMNGVISIITKHASKTVGGVAELSLNEDARGIATWRYGAKLGADSFARLYLQGQKSDDFEFERGGNADDSLENYHTGFRWDKQFTSKDFLTVNGSVYKGGYNHLSEIPTREAPFKETQIVDAYSKNHNIQLHWQHTLSSGATFSIRSWYDYSLRREARFNQKYQRGNVDFQFSHLPNEKHQFIWGIGYRYSDHTFIADDFSRLYHNRGNEELFNVFAQDEIQLLKKKLWLTLGSKVEYSEIRGVDLQPSIRLLWAINPRHKLWASVSRAVRTPAIIEREMEFVRKIIPASANPTEFPMEVKLLGNPNLKAEKLTAWEMGYRVKLTKRLSTDFSIFYNNYDDSVFVTLGGVSVNPNTGFAETVLLFGNTTGDYTQGFEWSTKWYQSKSTQWQFIYSFLDEQYNNAIAGTKTARHQLGLRGLFKVHKNVDADFWLRLIDERQPSASAGAVGQKEAAYASLDLRLAWRPIKALELSLVGQNLIKSKHMEFRTNPLDVVPTTISRGFYAKLLWRF